MAFQIIHRRRKVNHGPGGKKWSDATTVSNYPTQLTVKGLSSTCECSRHSECDECREGEHVYMSILGVFNADLIQRCFVYWGFISWERDNLVEEARGVLPGEGNICHPPKNAQLVYGWYTPYPTDGTRGWMEPCPEGMTLRDLFTLLYNTAELKREPVTPHDPAAELTQGRVLPLQTLFHHMQKQTKLILQLRHTRDNVVGPADIFVMGARKTDEGMLFTLRLNHRRDGGQLFSDLHPDARVFVSDDGSWEKIQSHKDSVPHEFVLA